jgi:DeoR/GlpR family transcriptional regulator of sugar metabolism
MTQAKPADWTARAARNTSDRGRPFPSLRHAHILRALSSYGMVEVRAVAAELGVSEMTIRRDLVDLENAGRLVRVHGGAVVVEGSKPADMDREEPQFSARLQRQRSAKEDIARHAADLAKDCRTIALDVGTTTFLVAQHLRSLTQSKIFTNSVRIATELANDEPEVYLSGGRMRRDEMSMSSRSAVEHFQSLWFDIAFIGVSGVTPNGFYDYSFEDAEMKRVYLKRSNRRILLCDSAKFDRMSLVHIGPLSEINIMITDSIPPPAISAALAEAGVQIEIVAAKSEPRTGE